MAGPLIRFGDTTSRGFAVLHWRSAALARAAPRRAPDLAPAAANATANTTDPAT